MNPNVVGEPRELGELLQDTEGAKSEDRQKQFKAMIDAGEYFDADTTTYTGSDDDGKILFVCVYARGESAVPLARFLKRQAKREAGKG